MFGRTRPLPADARRSLAELTGPSERVLAWADGPAGPVVATLGLFAVSTTEGWALYPWHLIHSGGWDPESSLLRWREVGGEEANVSLERPGPLPDVFRQRVTESIIVHRRVSLAGSLHVVLALRRHLSPGSQATEWLVHPGPGVDLAHPEVAARVEQELAQARSEYDIS